MSIYQVFVINRAGSLIYDWDGKEDSVGVEKTFSYPLDIVLDVLDQKVTVVFGERDGIFLRYFPHFHKGTRAFRLCFLFLSQLRLYDKE